SGRSVAFTYTAAKHAVVRMTKHVALQYGGSNIHSNAIAPGQIEIVFAAAMDNIDQYGMEAATRAVNLIPNVGKPEDVANIALFLASDESRYINGVTLAADAGWSAY